MGKSSRKKSRAFSTGRRPKSIAGIPVLDVKKGASLKAIYAAARKAFTAADLQKYTEIEEGMPAERVLAELEATCQKERDKTLGATP
jgi:hypothetical protein